MKLIEALKWVMALKDVEYKKNTKASYNSFIRSMAEYLVKKGKSDYLLKEFDKQEAILYLDYLLIEKKVSAITRNNHLKSFLALFNILKERGHIGKNCFHGIKKIKEAKKRRQVYSRAEAQLICNYLKNKDEGLLLAVSLCYYCALRATEIRDLRIRDINLEKGLITIDGTETKNKDLAGVTMSKHFVKFCKKINLDKYPPHYYAVGFKLLPSAQQCGTSAIRRRHLLILRELEKYKLLKDVQNKTFYSWKDTGARDMLEDGIDAAALMRHFRHKNLSTTQRYIESFGVRNDRIRDFKGKLI